MTARRRGGRLLTWLSGAWLCVALTGCHGAQVKPDTRAVSSVEMEPLQLEVVRGAGGSTVQVEAYDAPTLFEQAGTDFDAQRYAEAAAGYNRLVDSFPGSPYAAPALYNAGLSYEGLTRYGNAAERYRQLVEKHDTSKHLKDALFRLGACYAETHRWPASVEVFSQVLQRGDLALSLDDRIEAMSRRSLASFEMNDLQVAERGFSEAVDYYKAHQSEERLESDFFLAMSHFYLAHLSHKQFRDQPLRLPQQQLEKDIEGKAKLFMTTQARYIDAIKVQNASWATASGYHIGTLYREMYDTLLKAPLPRELDNEVAKLAYEMVLKDRLRVLLEKAKGILEKNVAMAGRVGVRNGWVERSSTQIEELVKLLAAIDSQPIGPEQAPVAPPAPADQPALRKPARPSGDYRPRVVL